MYQIILGILSFILIQIIRSSDCDSNDENDSNDSKEEILLVLSSQEVIQIPLNELIYPSSSLILCHKHEQFDINIIDAIQQIQQFQHRVNETVKQLKQYKNSKNRIPRQSSMVILSNTNVQLVNIQWNKDPQIEIIHPNFQKKQTNLEFLENYILINFVNEARLYEAFSEAPPKASILGCTPPTLTDQLNNQIFSTSHQLLRSHIDWEKNNLCGNDKVAIECQIESIEIKNAITNLQIYQTDILTFTSDNILVTLDLQSTIAKCQYYPKILAYDYDLIKNIFVIVHTDKIEYDGETYQLIYDQQQTQVFITKSFIIFRNGYKIQLFSKKLRLISTKEFDDDFQILTNQLQDQFILVDRTHIQKYILHENSFIEINKKQNDQINLLQEIYDKESHKRIELFIQADYNLGSFNISDTKEVSAIFNDKLINFKYCSYDALIMGPQLFQRYNQLTKIYSYKINVFDLDKLKIIFAFSSSYIYLGTIHNTNLLQLIQYTILDEVINKSNCAFQIQDNKINFIHCTNASCYIYYDIRKNYDQKKAKKVDKNKVEKVVSDNNHFYLLISQEVLFFHLVDIEPQKLQIQDKVKDIFASPKKKDYLFVLTESSRLYLYSISYPFQDLIQIFQLNYNEFIDFIIFENYFLIFANQNEQVVCNVYNYKNELNIFLQRKLPIFIFTQIHFDELQVDYDQNTLYLKGVLNQPNEYAIVAYRIDKRIELSIQFISKSKEIISFLLPISDRMILRFENKNNLTSIFYNGDKETSCLINKFVREDDMDEDDSFSETESEIEGDDTLSLDESYHFSTSSFISISSAGELLILGMQSIYGRQRHENIDIFQPL